MKNKIIFNELIRDRSSEFKNLGKRINTDNLIYKYKSEGRNPKNFRNYQTLIELLKDLIDGIINPKEVLKGQIDLKSDLGETKKGNPKSKSENQISAIQNILKFFDLRERIISFFKRWWWWWWWWLVFAI